MAILAAGLTDRQGSKNVLWHAFLIEKTRNQTANQVVFPTFVRAHCVLLAMSGVSFALSAS